MLALLCDEIQECAVAIFKTIGRVQSSQRLSDLMSLNEILSGKIAAKAAVRIHLLTLLFEGDYQEMRVPCVKVMKCIGLLPQLVNTLIKTRKIVKAGGFGFTPKWLAPLLLLIDLYQKFSNYSVYKNQMHEITTRMWKWYDVVAAKWNSYSESNNKIINDAYWKGDATVRISCGRQRYLINFSCMTQVNEETGNHRLVILGLNCTELERSSESKIFDELNGSLNYLSLGLSPEEQPLIVQTCVELLRYTQDRDTLHAVMRLLLRLTRNYTNAKVFAEEGGVTVLLEMTQSCGYIGFVTLATLLIRHVLEEPITLGLAMQNVIYSRTMQTIPPGYKELFYLTRQISAAVSREPDCFHSVANQILRIDLSVLRKNALKDDQRILLKSIKVEQLSEQMTEPIALQTVQNLLNCLIRDEPIPGEIEKIKKKSASQHFNFHQFQKRVKTERESAMKRQESEFNERLKSFVRFHLDILSKNRKWRQNHPLENVNQENDLLSSLIDEADDQIDQEVEKINEKQPVHHLIIPCDEQLSDSDQFNQVFLAHQINQLEYKLINNLIDSNDGRDQLIDLTDNLNLEIEICEEKAELKRKNQEIYELVELEWFEANLCEISQSSKRPDTNDVPKGYYNKNQTDFNQKSTVLVKKSENLQKNQEKPPKNPESRKNSINNRKRQHSSSDDDDYKPNLKMFAPSIELIRKLSSSPSPEFIDEPDYDLEYELTKEIRKLRADEIKRRMTQTEQVVKQPERPKSCPPIIPTNSKRIRPPAQPKPQQTNFEQNNRPVTEDKQLLPKSAILKILAESIRSYPTVANNIAVAEFTPDQSALIESKTTAISFILDHLLPVNEQQPPADRECSTMARMLIAALASCNEQTDVQVAVVREVKMALYRALKRPETMEKHAQIQLICGLIPTMIENCPPDNPAMQKLHQIHPRRNTIYYIMVRKGLIIDLARISQSLDLSSRYTVGTINSALKPLEILLRMTNQPLERNDDLQVRIYRYF